MAAYLDCLTSTLNFVILRELARSSYLARGLENDALWPFLDILQCIEPLTLHKLVGSAFEVQWLEIEMTHHITRVTRMKIHTNVLNPQHHTNNIKSQGIHNIMLTYESNNGDIYA